jgi:hypothetical protein
VVIVVDSSAPPTAEQIASAKAAGVGAWLGYLASGPREGLLHPWTAADFQLVQTDGLLTAAYCSGLDDPAWVKEQLTELGIPGLLDDETDVEGSAWSADATEVDTWLEASGTGLYGSATVMAAHRTHGHPAYVCALYPPGATQAVSWPPSVAAPAPPRPTGWQWAGTVTTPYGVVDRSNFSPGFWPSPAPSPPEEDPMVICCPRPDGGTDYYGLAPNGQMWHVVWTAAGAFGGRDEPPGNWAQLIRCEYAGAAAQVIGIGLVDGAAWECSCTPGSTPWELTRLG